MELKTRLGNIGIEGKTTKMGTTKVRVFWFGLDATGSG